MDHTFFFVICLDILCAHLHLFQVYACVLGSRDARAILLCHQFFALAKVFLTDGVVILVVFCLIFCFANLLQLPSL